MNTQTVTINLVPGLSTPPVVNVKQGDIGRPIAFRVMDGTGLMTVIAGATAKIEGTKPSGLGFSVTGTISGNMVTLDTTEAMTQEAGRIPAEISFTKTGLVLGTANFILAVERDPHPENVIDGTYETMDDIQTQVNALDTRVTALEAGGGGSGLTDDVKTALLNCFAHVAWVDADGQDYYDALESALDSGDLSVSLMLSQVSSSNTATTVGYGESYTTTLTASTGYTLNTVSVTMRGVDITSTSYSSGTVSIPSVTGNIVITATAVLAAQSITATYTQSGTVYDTDSLDSLKPDLVVTANYSGGTSETVPASDYTLSGTLAVGTSTITVSYAGLTDTFSVTVSHIDNSIISWDFTQSMTDTKQGLVATLNGNATQDSSGLHINSASDYAILGNIFAEGQYYEIDVASMDVSGWTSGVGRLFIWYPSNGSGLVYDSTNSRWTIYDGTWQTPSAEYSAKDFFANSTIKIVVGSGSSQYRRLVTIYKNDTELFSFNTNKDIVTATNVARIGHQNGSSFSMTITGFRVYSGV